MIPTGEKHPMHKKAVRQLRKAQQIRTVTQLLLEGRTHSEIAAAAGISKRTVERMIPAFRKECLAKAEEDNAELVVQALARYNSIYQEAMEAWRRSQENKESVTTEEPAGVEATTIDDDGKSVVEKPRAKRTRRVEGQTGDATFLEKALNAQAKICELKGLNKPREAELTISLASLYQDPLELESDNAKSIGTAPVAAIGCS